MKNIIFVFLFFFVNINLLSANWDSPKSITNQNKKSLKIQQKAGDIGAAALNLFALGLIIHHNDSEGLREYMYSGVSTAGIVFAGKHMIGKERPDNSDNLSMPSGHSAFSFMAATFITQRYGNKYAVPTYLTSSFVAYSRVASKKHFISDVIVGGAIGIATASLFTKNYNLNINGSKHNLLIEPMLTKNSFNIHLELH